MRATYLILATMVAAFPAAASAQTAVADDARCLIVSSTYARTAKDPKAQQVAQTASAFYLGRIDGRYPPAALKAALAAQVKLLTAANAPAIMNGCAARVGQAEARIQGVAPPSPRTQPGAKVGR
ncbi:MAG: hypothetical protein JWM75_1842 [Sphingomonas bacterium]|nr:hypothetical protein [Sphingomonas bacterium]